MKKQYSRLILVAVLATVAGMSGCSSTMTREEIAEEEIQVQEMRADAKAQMLEAKQERLEKALEDVPEWVIEPPRADGTGFYGVGTGASENVTISARKANLQAKFELASTLKSELSGEDTMNGSDENNYRYVINNFVDKVHLTGYETVKRKVVTQEGKYVTYVLLKMPYSKFNEVVNNQEDSDVKETLQDSYARLMERVSKQ